MKKYSACSVSVSKMTPRALLKIYKRNRAVYLKELKYKNSKKQENINTNTLYSKDIDEILSNIKYLNNKIQVSKNN